jgi:hypothetical protein
MLDVSVCDTEPLGLIITLPAAESNRPVESDELGARSPASGDAAVGGLSLATFILECEHKDLAIER